MNSTVSIERMVVTEKRGEADKGLRTSHDGEMVVACCWSDGGKIGSSVLGLKFNFGVEFFDPKDLFLHFFKGQPADVTSEASELD